MSYFFLETKIKASEVGCIEENEFCQIMKVIRDGGSEVSP